MITMTLQQAQQLLTLTTKWERFKHDRSIKFEFEELDFITKIYKDVFNVKIDTGCSKCVLDSVTSLMIHAEAQREQVEALELAKLATDEIPETETKPITENVKGKNNRQRNK